MTERRPFDPNHFVETLRREGHASIHTPGGATVLVTVQRDEDGDVVRSSPVTYRCSRCEKTLVLTIQEGLGVRIREVFDFLERHKHTPEAAS